ncbi:MAG: helix-turn-helix transcriptional regulator [Leptospiraceae bacterium]|nr:helix-turn-helix transcriptional regulator [Leptospiraceae bacterium]
MYNPVKDGIEKTFTSVKYLESKPPNDLSRYVHNFWELKTDSILHDNFCLHVIPDACVNILFNLMDTKIAGVTALHTSFEVLNLGRSFHYAGIQFLPGVWNGDRNEIIDTYVGSPYLGKLPLVETSIKLKPLDFSNKQPIFSELVRWFIKEEFVANNLVTEKILLNLEEIQTVEDMASVVEMSPRQLQRTLKKMIGFSPHDFLKVLRLQNSFKGQYLASFSDQSHFIHSFKKITGYTPVTYYNKFDV